MTKAAQDELPLKQEPGWNDIVLTNGFTRTPNDLYEQLYKSNLSASTLRFMLCVIRFTYGYNRRFTMVARSIFADELEVSDRTVRRMISDAESAGVIIRKGRLLGIQTQYDLWDTDADRPSNNGKEQCPFAANQETSKTGPPSVRSADPRPSAESDPRPSGAKDSGKYKGVNDKRERNTNNYATHRKQATLLQAPTTASTESNAVNGNQEEGVTETEETETLTADTPPTSAIVDPGEMLYWFDPMGIWVNWNPETTPLEQQISYIKASYASQNGQRVTPDFIDECCEMARKMREAAKKNGNGNGKVHSMRGLAEFGDYETCPMCGGEMIPREGKFGWWVGCSGYPKCRHAFGLAV